MPEILASLRQMKTIQEPTTRSGLTLMQDFSCPEKVRGVLVMSIRMRKMLAEVRKCATC